MTNKELALAAIERAREEAARKDGSRLVLAALLEEAHLAMLAVEELKKARAKPKGTTIPLIPLERTTH